MSFTQRIEVLIKAIEVVPLTAFIEGKLEPLHILWIATMGVTGEAWGGQGLTRSSDNIDGAGGWRLCP